jgi:methylmalonyl-CoA mutase
MSVDELSFAEFPEVDRAAWRAAVDKILKGADFDRRMVTRTEDGLAIQPLYGPDDPADDGGVPGRFPYVRSARGLDASWRLEQRHAHPDPATANAQALDDLEHGVEALRLVVADPLDEDPDGILLKEPGELARVLDKIVVDAAPVSLEAGSRGLEMARALVARWRESGADPASVAGDLHLDPLATLARTGKLHQEPRDAFAEIAGFVGELDGRFTQVRALGADLRPAHEAGAGPSLELAIGLAQAAEVLRLAEAGGLAPEVAARQLTWLVPVDDDVFMGLAKLRALRRCWSTMARAVGDEAAPRIVAETSRRMLARRDAYVNLLRNTLAAFAGATGGADALTVLPFTASMGLPDRSARRMARNTQLILRDEAMLARIVDPGGGAFYVENLTDQLAAAAWSTFQELEREGGFLTLLDNGEFAKRIDAQWAKRERALATRREMITGVSAFPLLDEHEVELDPFDPSGTKAALAATRPAVAKTVPPLPRRRVAERFEALRDAADRAAEARGRPEVLLVHLGSLAESNVRASWTRSLMEAGGLACVDSAPVADAAAVAEACSQAGPFFAVLCSTDARYAELAEAAAKAAKEAGVGTVGLAGRPGENEAAWRAAGIDVFLYAGMDVLAELEAAHQRLGLAA